MMAGAVVVVAGGSWSVGAGVGAATTVLVVVFAAGKAEVEVVGNRKGVGETNSALASARWRRMTSRFGEHNVTGSFAFGKLSVTSSITFGNRGGKVGPRRVFLGFGLGNGPPPRSPPSTEVLV